MKLKDFYEVTTHSNNFTFLKVYSLERPEDKRMHHYFLSPTGVVFRVVVDTETDEIVFIGNERG